jgi:Uma2 family endonuclease
MERPADQRTAKILRLGQSAIAACAKLFDKLDQLLGPISYMSARTSAFACKRANTFLHSTPDSLPMEPMATSPRRLRAEDLPDVPVPDESLGYELVDGELVPVMPAGIPHNELLGVLWKRLMEFQERSRSGRVFYDSWCKLVLARDPEQVRAPDLSWVGNEKLRRLGGKLPIMLPFPPDLAIEVYSPANERKTRDFHQRIRDYLDANIPLVWVIYPDSRYATVYHADGSARVLREHEWLDGEDVLPDFRIALNELFGALEPDLPE